jgi:hypothetical protein
MSSNPQRPQTSSLRTVKTPLEPVSSASSSVLIEDYEDAPQGWAASSMSSHPLGVRTEDAPEDTPQKPWFFACCPHEAVAYGPCPLGRLRPSPAILPGLLSRPSYVEERTHEAPDRT